MPVGVDDLFAYHASPGALGRLLPPWQAVDIVSSDQSLEPGSRVVLRIPAGPLSVLWIARHGNCQPPWFFEDVQEQGPMAAWHHQHRFTANEQDPTAHRPNGSTLTDRIDYRMPLGRIGQALLGLMVRGQLESMFRYRHRVTREDLAMLADQQFPPQRIAISGATGLVGRQLCSLLGVAGHQVVRLVRSLDDVSAAADESPPKLPAIAPWHDDQQLRQLDGVDSVIHLAGYPIAEKRWTSRVKRMIRDSRVQKTRQLCESLARLDNPPKTLLCASATGIYGDQGDRWVDESAPPGEGFLAEVAEAWEAACQPARQASIRVVHLRFGIVLSPRGGALAKMLTPAKLGLAGRLGSGRQWWSWIGIDDAIRAIYHTLATPSLSGPVNIVSPQSLTNADFTNTLGRVLHRPTILPAPALGLRLLLGEMAGPLLLASTRVRPTQLIDSGFQFNQGELHDCLAHLLGKTTRQRDHNPAATAESNEQP